MEENFIVDAILVVKTKYGIMVIQKENPKSLIPDRITLDSIMPVSEDDVAMAVKSLLCLHSKGGK